LLKENNNLLNKEDDGTKPVRGKRGRKSASEASENINSMKVQINTSDCDMTADELTADETMNDETLDTRKSKGQTSEDTKRLDLESSFKKVII